MTNNFFKKKKNIKINQILDLLKLKKQKNNFYINDIKELETASKNDITFFHSIKYSSLLNNTRSKFVVTNKKLSNLIPKKNKQSSRI